MVRLVVNRWWTFILALVICFASSLHSRTVFGNEEIGAPVPSNPAGSGDPDSPTGPGKSAPRGAIERPGENGVLGMRPVGDGTASESVWMSRLLVMLQSLGKITFRF